ncbi:MAG TPA: flagellar basal body P-ring protein FlgI [Phycisphaerae bacterium]|nr:flagellar basal body P-ring protein FlgI [Phycisphaerae bacterium]
MVRKIAQRMMAAAIVSAGMMAGAARAEKIGDVVRLKNDQPNELVGMGLVVGLKGTGDGGDFKPAMRPLIEMLKRFQDPVQVDTELKNANNVAIVSLSVKVPAHGVNSGDRLDVRVSALAAKSLKGGHLFIGPLVAPRTDVKMILGYASGQVLVDDDSVPTGGVIKGGAVMTEDVLPEEVKGDTFTLVLRPEAASLERANAVADTINSVDEVSTQTGGQPAAIAVDATSVNVTIPKAERAHATAFISRLLEQQLEDVSEPAKVCINLKTKTIVFTAGVELAPTTINQGGMTITIGKDGTPTKLKDLMDAFDMMKVGGDDRISIVQLLAEKNVLRARLEVE